jgi:arylsulfatase A-like enzyme
VPEILQYHYVDTERLQLGYLLRKGYQRTRSTSRIQGNGRVPLYMWRKVAEYSFHTVFSLSWARRRFYLVRMAAALGEVKGRAESGHRGHGLDLPPDRGILGTWVLGIFALVSGLMAWFFSGENLDAALFPVVGVAGVGSAALLTKSLLDFSQTGPRIREEILTHYRRYTLYALARLAFWAFVLMAFSAGGGVLAYYALNVALAGIWSPWLATVAATLGVLGATGVQFIRMLRHNPGLLVASMHYRMSRLYPLWQLASVRRIRIFLLTLTMAAATLMLAASWRLAAQAHTQELAALWCALLAYVSLTAWTVWVPKAQPVRNKISVTNARPTNGRPNILLIGSDTLRADRLGALGYHRAITPNIDALSTQGILFENCYVPCARTAPSLVSLLTGTWPHTHGIRDNFVADAETQLTVDALPTLLKPLGYRSAAISDWCGADMGKLSFGFDYTDLPEDQWNIKYLIRQGPKDLRLFISLFVHNRLGRLLLPELYYLGGVPLTSQLGSRARRLVSRLAASEQPFFLDVFYSTTHPPFASEWPWYTRFSDPAYAGESKFAMAKLTDPFEIIRRQGQPKEEFDLDQIINLYDGSVAQFDEEVGKMLRHLDESGLANNTIVVVYSDHGMEFFEHDTWGQGNSAVGDFSPRVPLLIRDPRRPAIGKVHEVVRSIDLAPTLMELIGSVPNQHMEGVSLVTCYDKAGGCPQLTAFSETGIWIADIPGMPENHLRYPGLLELLEVTDTESGTLGLRQEYKTAILRAKDRMLRDGKWKLVYQPLEKGHLLRLFDLESDPNCMHNTLDRNQEMRAQLWNRLSTWIKRDEEICNRDLKKP